MDDLDIQAYLDNELPNKRREQIQKAMRTNPVLRQRYEQLKEQKKLIKLYWESLEKIH